MDVDGKRCKFLLTSNQKKSKKMCSAFVFYKLTAVGKKVRLRQIFCKDFTSLC